MKGIFVMIVVKLFSETENLMSNYQSIKTYQAGAT